MSTAPWLRPIPEEPPASGTPTPAPTPGPGTPGGGSNRLLRSFVDKSLARVKPSTAAVWFALFRHSTNGVACVAQAQIARIIGMSENTVERAMEELRRKGLVGTLRRGSNLTERASVCVLRGVIREHGEPSSDTPTGGGL